MKFFSKIRIRTRAIRAIIWKKINILSATDFESSGFEVNLTLYPAWILYAKNDSKNGTTERKKKYSPNSFGLICLAM